MHPRVIAERTSRAYKHITEAAAFLGRRLEIEAEAQAVASATHREPGLRALFRLEATAAFVLKLAERAGATSADIPSLGHAEPYSGIQIGEPGEPLELAGEAELDEHGESGPLDLSEPEPAEPDDFTALEGIGPTTAAALQAAGFLTFADLGRADDEALLAVSGMSRSRLKAIRDHAKGSH